MAGEISIDKDATIANSHAHIEFAGQLRQQAAGHAAAMGAAVNNLGDLYADYKDAMTQSLIPEFLGAHNRLADLHEAHGYKGLHAVQAFSEQDSAGAASANEIAT